LTTTAPETKHGKANSTSYGDNWLMNAEIDGWLKTLGTDFRRGIPMTRSEVLYERFRGTRFGWFLTHPLTVLVTRLLGVTAFLISLLLLFNYSQTSSQEAQIARREAAKAVAQERANAKAQQERAAALSIQTRKQLCVLVSFNADTRTYPPTTQRGYQIAEQWKQFGNSPGLRCGIK
jgi:hypothetical protein